MEEIRMIQEALLAEGWPYIFVSSALMKIPRRGIHSPEWIDIKTHTDRCRESIINEMSCKIENARFEIQQQQQKLDELQSIEAYRKAVLKEG